MRARFRFSKLGKIRFTSHRDVARLWERALRRAELPVALTEGFSPRPKVHFGLALSTSHESLGEYIDIDFREPECDQLDLDALPELLTALLPEGLTVQAVAPITTSQTSLQQAVTSCEWEIDALGLESSAPFPASGRRTAPVSSPPPAVGCSPSWPPNPEVSGRRSCWPPSGPRSPKDEYVGPINGSRSTAPARNHFLSARRGRRTPRRVRHEKGTPA